MMNLIEYRIGNIKKYEADIWQSGVCSGLAEIRLTASSGSFEGSLALWDSTGHVNIEDYIRLKGRAGVTDAFFKILCAFRKIVEAEMNAAEYIIDHRHISLDKDRIWLDAKCSSAALLPVVEGECSGEGFVARLSALADMLGAGELSDKLDKMNSEALMSETELLRLLSSWELELR